ncbi:MAG: lipoyl synthase [Chlamydiota bacterium]
MSEKNPLHVLPNHSEKRSLGRFPSWLHRTLPAGNELKRTQAILRKNQLNTVCEEAKCPNRLECYSRKTATFLVLGKSCTRACGFCEIDFAKHPAAPDSEEPRRIAQSVKELGLSHVVITMVARDDLKDHGACHIAAIVKVLRSTCAGVTVELLTSDFGGDRAALDTALATNPEIFNHNLETVRRLTPRVRHKATYERTLSLLSYVSGQKKAAFVKSGLMVGLGEQPTEVEAALVDLHAVGCSIVTIGQYLQPSRRKLLVKSFVTPEQFAHYEAYGKALGIPHLYAGPFVRSSYNAALLKDQAFRFSSGG